MQNGAVAAAAAMNFDFFSMRNLLKNTGSNVALLVAKVIITFVMTPVIVRALGNYDYGIWEMVIGVMGYMGLLDLGFKPAISRYAARFNAQNSTEDLQILVSTTLSFLGLVGGVVAALFAGWALLFPDSLAPPGDSGRYTWFLLIVGCQLLIAFPGSLAESMLEGLQLYYVKNNITIFNSVVGAVVTYLFIARFDALIFLALVNGIGTATKFFTFFVLLKKARGSTLTFTIRRRSMAFFKESLGFSAKSFIQGIATSVESNSPPLIIGTLLGPATVVFYALPAAMVRHVRNLGWTLTHAFMPLFSDLHARRQGSQLGEMYVSGSRVVIAALAPVVAIVVILGPEFIDRWVGHEYGERANSLLPLVAGAFLLSFVNPLASRYLTAIGQHGFLAKIGPLAAAVNIGASVVLARLMGIEGVAIGALIPALVFTPLITRHVCAHLGVSSLAYLRATLLPVGLPIALMCLVGVQLKKVIEADDYVSILSIAVLAMAVYLAAIPFLSMSGRERRGAMKAIYSWLQRTA